MLIEAAFVQQRIRISNIQSLSQVIAQIIWISWKHLWLTSIQPVVLHTIAVVMLVYLLPDELARLRVGRIIIVKIGRPLWAMIKEGHKGIIPPFRSYEQTTCLHHGKVFAQRIDGSPD